MLPKTVPDLYSSDTMDNDCRQQVPSVALRLFQIRTAATQWTTIVNNKFRALQSVCSRSVQRRYDGQRLSTTSSERCTPFVPDPYSGDTMDDDCQQQVPSVAVCLFQIRTAATQWATIVNNKFRALHSVCSRYVQRRHNGRRL